MFIKLIKEIELKFNKYNSLVNHTQAKFLHTLLIEGLGEGEFVATEKAHGANFGFHCEGDGVRASKRSGIIGTEEHFHGSVGLTREHGSRVKSLYHDLATKYPELGDSFNLAIRGEVIGGMFQEVQAKHASRVQKEVQYCSTNEFLAFDIEINGLAIPYLEFLHLTNKWGFHVCPEIKRGTLKELLDIPNDFDSVIPAMFDNTPFLSGNEILKDNITEGLVIKPLRDNRFTSKGVRVIVKSKNSKFTENAGAKKKSPVNTLTDEENDLGMELTAFFSEQRISNVLSKESVITSWKDFPSLAGKLFQDAIQDFNDERDCDLREILGDNWKSFVRAYKFISDERLREHFKEVL